MSLFEQACEVRLNAYAPYSGFKVGAALRVSSGKTFVGCNVENAAYPEGTCAEAGAIAAMVAAGESEIEEIFIVAVGSEPISPCGGCRQKISEFSRSDTPVILANPNGDMVHKTAGELLPDSFKPSHLEK